MDRINHNLTPRDYTPTGMKLNGPYENDRNQQCQELYKAIIREAFGVTDCIIGHHLVFVRTYKDKDGFDIQVVEEIASADTLLFDHEVARVIWGEDEYRSALAALAMVPAERRDDVLAEMYYNRKPHAYPRAA